MRELRWIALVLLSIVPCASAQEEHSHHAQAQLGSVSFATSCSREVQEQFKKGGALIPSFEYTTARETFQQVAALDPSCAMAHWGIALSYFLQLWEPPIIPTTIPAAQKEIQMAAQSGSVTARESGYIHA